MRTVHIRSLTLVAVVLVALTANVFTQDRSPAILSTVEVQRLITRAEPADHAGLNAHFAALADEYNAEAKRHTAMQQAYGRNTKTMPAMATSMSAHCKRLAELSLASATASREVAAEHGKLAAGAKYEAPRSGPSQDAQARAVPTDQAFIDLAASASTAADHRRLEEYFTAQATRYDREAADHAAYAKSWKSSTKVATAAKSAAHCELIATQRADAAKEARAAAAMHKDHAAQAK